jgi:hypothetical protein
MRFVFRVAALVVFGYLVAVAIESLGLAPATEAASKCIVPKSWGALRSISEGTSGSPVLFAFEDEAGTVRVTVSGCKPGAILHQIDRQ